MFYRTIMMMLDYRRRGSDLIYRDLQRYRILLQVVDFDNLRDKPYAFKTRVWTAVRRMDNIFLCNRCIFSDFPNILYYINRLQKMEYIFHRPSQCNRNELYYVCGNIRNDDNDTMMYYVTRVGSQPSFGRILMAVIIIYEWEPARYGQ